MAINFKVFTKFGGKDETSDKFNKMSKNAKQFGKAADKSFKRASKSALSFKSVVGGVLAAGALTKGISLLGRGLSTAAGEFLEFDEAITAASAKFKGLDLSTEQGKKTLEQLGKTARAVAATTKFSAGEAAQSLDFYATAGFKAEQAMALLEPTARLAMAGNIDLARASDIAGDAIGIFGLQVEDSAELQKNFMTLSDQMSKTMTSTNVTVDQLFETIKGGGAIFTQAGQKMSTFNTIAGTLAKRSIKGEKAGIAMRSMMTSLAKATPEAQVALDMLGVRVRDSKGNFRDLIDIFGDMKKGMEGMGDAEKLAGLKTIFGKQTISAVSAVLEGTNESLREYRREIENSSGATEKMAEIMSKSLKNQLASLRSAAIDVGFQIFKAFKTDGAGAIESFTAMVRKIDLTPFINGIKTAFSVIGKIYDFLQPFSGAIQVVVGALIAYSIAAKGVAIAQGLMNLAMNASIFGLIITGVTLLVAAGVALYDNWDTIVTMAKSVWGWFNKILDNPLIATAAAIFAPFITIPALIFKHWLPIKDFFAGLFDKISNVAGIASRFFGFGGSDSSQSQTSGNGSLQVPPRQPPNQVQVESKQEVSVGGRIDIANAPKGSTVTRNKGTQIDLSLLGMP